MRTFDYQRLPQSLFSGAIGEANAKIHECKGKLDMLEQVRAEELSALCERAHFDNVDASTRIEGLYVDAGKTRAIIGGAQPDGETEAQIAGYSKALRLVEESAGDLPLSTATILELFETMYSHRDFGRKSRYRKKDYAYVQVDGHMQAMPVSPITAFETPLVLGGACDGLSSAFGANACSPLVLGAVFTVDFLAIRPFEEGNGRISRLFAELMLEKSGFHVARYVSIDRIMENSGMGYYDALNACVEGWDRGRNDYAPYVTYWLDVILKAYNQLFDIVSAEPRQRLGKSERVMQFVQRAGSSVTKRQIRDALPDVSEATVEAALGKLVKEGKVEKLGAGRSTSYRWM